MQRVRLKTADMTGTANYELDIGNEYSHTGGIHHFQYFTPYEGTDNDITMRAGYLHSAAATLILGTPQRRS